MRSRLPFDTPEPRTWFRSAASEPTRRAAQGRFSVSTTWNKSSTRLMAPTFSTCVPDILWRTRCRKWAPFRMTGSVAGPLRPDLKVPMIATRDIGAAAADALLRLDFRGKQTRELLGERDLDYAEVASIIGDGIGKPGLGYIQMPDEQMKPALVQMGMSENFVGLLLEMAGSLNTGHMRALEPRSARNTTPTPYETFVAEEFMPAYKQQAAA